MPGDGRQLIETPEAAGRGPDRLWRPSVTLVLAASMALLVLLSVVLVITIQVSASQRNTFQLLGEVTALVVEYMDRSLRDHLEPARDQAAFIARQIESGAIDLQDRARLRDLLTGAVAGTPQITALLTWDTDLRRFAVWREADGTSGIMEGEFSDDPLMRATAEEMKTSEGAVWGKTVFRGNAPRINLRQPLRHDGETVGLLVATISVQDLSALAADLSRILEGTAFVLEGTDGVLAHPNLVSAHPDQSPESPVVRLDRVGDPVLAEIWNGRPIEGLSAEGLDATVVRTELGDQEYAFVYRELADYGPKPWYIGAWFLLTADNVVDRLVRSIEWSLLLLVLAVAAAFLLGRLIARPIRRVAEGTARIGHLDLAHVDTLGPSRLRELDNQAQAFNAMLASLKSFETYVPRRLVTRLIQAGGEQAVTSEERELTILFTDIADFTRLSEHIPAAEVAAFLNQHFALLGSCVETEDGTVDKFIGDALMAFWGAPDPQPDTAARACRAALAMAAAVTADNDKRRAEGKPPVRLRIGIHTGPVVVGNIGWPGRINYTIVGDTVNSSQRLEALGKDMGEGEDVVILVSGATAGRLDDGFKLDFAGRFEVRGKSDALEVYRLHT
ncbi:MAG: adenylate/guanylate cyclase domain-containing protein [Kiloniellales bacterium]|nr:adenylate/guanylate cyclase domain-containing protein [Kiloniellales bacterium]